MTTINPGLGRLLAGLGGAALIASLFISWIDADGVSRSGWEALSTFDAFLLMTGLLGISAALTGGRFGFFRPDLSLNATADIFAVAASILVGCFLVFDVPSGASAEVGAYLALIAAIATATGAGDFRVTSLFPRLPDGEERS